MAKQQVLAFIQEHGLIPVSPQGVADAYEKETGIKYTRQYIHSIAIQGGLKTAVRRKRSLSTCPECNKPVRRFHNRPSRVHTHCNQTRARREVICAYCNKPLVKPAGRTDQYDLHFCNENHRVKGIKMGLVKVGKPISP